MRDGMGKVRDGGRERESEEKSLPSRDDPQSLSKAHIKSPPKPTAPRR